MASTDDRKVYMFRFITMATVFKSYWLAGKSGDRVTMEGIKMNGLACIC